MHLLDIHLVGSDLSEQRRFYGEVLGLPVLWAREDRLSLQVGQTRLTFEAGAPLPGPYHLAFDVPEHLFEEAEAWLRLRAPLLSEDGQHRSFSEEWNAHMLYFRDADGNILELIARHTLPRPGATGLLLNVSEVGVAVPDVPQTARFLRNTLGLQGYGDSSDRFTPLGTTEGLFIVVAQGRPWFPTVQEARPLPLRVVARTPGAGQLTLPEGPVQISGVTYP